MVPHTQNVLLDADGETSRWVPACAWMTRGV